MCSKNTQCLVRSDCNPNNTLMFSQEWLGSQNTRLVSCGVSLPVELDCVDQELDIVGVFRRASVKNTWCK